MSTSIRVSLATLKRLHELRKYPSGTLDSVISRLIAYYLKEEEPPIVLWGHINKKKPLVRTKKLLAKTREKRSVKTLQFDDSHRLRFY